MTQKDTHSRLGWSMFLLAAVFYAIDYFQHTAPSVLLAPVAQSFDVPITDIGRIMSLYFPFYALSQIPAGYVIDRFGLPKALGTACLITSIGLLTMTVPSQAVLAIGRILVAIGSGFAFIGALKTASMWLPQSFFPIAVGLTNTLGVCGGLMGQPMLEALIDSATWQKAVLWIGLFGFFWTFILFSMLRNKHETTASFSFENGVFKDIPLYLMSLYAGIMVGTIVNAFSELYDVVFLEKSFNISAQTAADISSLLFIGIAVGGPLHGVIARRLGNKMWMILGCILSIISFSAIVILRDMALHEILLGVLYFLTGFFVSSMLLAYDVAKKRLPSEAHTTAFAIINMTIGLCGFLFQFLLGELVHTLQGIFTGQEAHLVFTASLLAFLAPLALSFVLLVISVPRSQETSTT